MLCESNLEGGHGGSPTSQGSAQDPLQLFPDRRADVESCVMGNYRQVAESRDQRRDDLVETRFIRHVTFGDFVNGALRSSNHDTASGGRHSEEPVLTISLR